MTTRGSLTVDEAVDTLRELRKRRCCDPVPRQDAAICLERARQWSPQTTDDHRAYEIYDHTTITGIKSVFPGFRKGADGFVLAGLIRQWASLHISMRHPPGSRRHLAAIARLFPKARRLRNGDFAASCPLHCPLHQDDQTTGLRGEDDKVRRPCDACGKESTVWGPGIQRCPDHSMTLGLQLSTGKRLEDGKLVVECSAGCDPGALRAEVKRLARAEGIELPEPSTDKGDLDRYEAVDKHGWEFVDMIRKLPDSADVLEALRALEIIARVKTKAKARGARVRRGRPEENAARLAVEQLCWIYKIVTGRPPGRDFDHYKKRGPSPFEKFAAAAIGRLWRNKSGGGRHIRAALRRYKNSGPDA